MPKGERTKELSVILFHLADKYVDPGATKFVSRFDAGPLGARKHESGPRPVHTVDYSETPSGSPSGTKLRIVNASAMNLVLVSHRGKAKWFE